MRNAAGLFGSVNLRAQPPRDNGREKYGDAARQSGEEEHNQPASGGHSCPTRLAVFGARVDGARAQGRGAATRRAALRAAPPAFAIPFAAGSAAQLPFL
jgi:hypothetical protein